MECGAEKSPYLRIWKQNCVLKSGDMLKENSASPPEISVCWAGKRSRSNASEHSWRGPVQWLRFPNRRACVHELKKLFPLKKTWLVEAKKYIYKIKSLLVNVCNTMRRKPLPGKWLGDDHSSHPPHSAPALSLSGPTGAGGRGSLFPALRKRMRQESKQGGGLVSVWLAVGPRGSLPPLLLNTEAACSPLGAFSQGS